MPGRRCVRMLTPPLLVLRVREQRSSSAVATASPASKSEVAHDDPPPKDPVPAAQVWAARPYYETSGTAGALTRTLRSAVLLWLSPPASPRPGFERTNCRLGQGAHPDEVAAEPPLRFTELYRQPRRPSGPGMGYRAAAMGYRAAWDTAPPWDTAPHGIPRRHGIPCRHGISRPAIPAGFESACLPAAGSELRRPHAWASWRPRVVRAEPWQRVLRARPGGQEGLAEAARQAPAPPLHGPMAMFPRVGIWYSSA